jgi:hypothetical protein
VAGEDRGEGRIRYLILATTGFVVFLDDDLEIDWKSTTAWDDTHAHHRDQLSEVLTRAAELESGEWDGSDEQKTINLRRQIGEAIARGLEGNFVQANLMLNKADAYRTLMLNAARRKQAISTQFQINDEWRSCYKRWIAVHYTVGIAALILSTLVASRPVWIGFNENGISLLAWLVAVLTGLLTFLTPDKKADKYLRAWSSLNSAITRYNADESYTVNDVLDAYHKGENVIFQTSGNERRRRT